MFFKERTGQEGILATSRRKIKQAGRLLMALAVGGCLWGQGEVGCAGTYYRFTNPSSGNVGTFSETGYSGNYTPVTSANETNDIVNIWSYNGGGSSDNNITINTGNYDFVTISSTSISNSNSGTSSSSNDGDVKNNTITINGGSVQTVAIGAVQNYNATTTGTTTTGIVTEIDNGNGNTITINGGNVGYAFANTININGGSITGFNYSDIGVVTDATGNIVASPSANAESPGEINIYNSPDLSGALIAASDIASIYASGSNYSTISADNNSVLNIHTKHLTAKNVSGFKNINFYLPSDIQNGDTVLTLTGYNYSLNGTNYSELTTNLSGTNIRAGVEGNANLSTGDTITLIKNANGITTDSTTTYGTLSEGVSLDYDLTVEKADDTSIVARVGSASPSPTNPTDSGSSSNSGSGGGMVSSSGSSALKEQTNVLPAPLLSNSVLSLQGTDRLLEWLPPEDPVVGEDTGEGKDDSKENVAKAESPNDFQIFANTGFSNLRTKTGGNSYMDNHSTGFDLGAARTLENSRGKLVFAPIVDYGSGSYDVYNGGRHGSGNSKYWAAGMIARQMNRDGLYYEASFRAGRTMVDFASDDFTQGGVPRRVTYDASAPCFAGHIRIGKLYQFGPRNQLHLYGIYSHNHQNGMTATLSTGETYHFSAVDSGRLRIGGRLSWQKSNTQKFYSGIAYQYEFSSGATGSYKGYSTSSSGIHGSSAMIELGWQIKPSRKSPWMVDVNAAGWVGHQRGFTIQAKLMKSF